MDSQGEELWIVVFDLGRDRRIVGRLATCGV